jgi:uncharacterized protein YndB with AHSA1/START domain
MLEPFRLPGPAAGIRLRRVFEAPRELVWKEWTEPCRFAGWFGGAETEVPLATVSIDLRPGGTWKATTLGYGLERRDICWSGWYLEIIEPERLSFTIGTPPDCHALEVVTVRLTDLGGRTEMQFRQRGHLTAKQYEQAAAAWSAEFDHITTRLSCQKRRHLPGPQSNSRRWRRGA